MVLDNYPFLSKADVLKFLQSRLKHSNIEQIYDFTVKEWDKNKTKILTTISNQFDSKFVIIRSSAFGEDSIENSQAGSYSSILNIPPTSHSKLKKAITSVIQSYTSKNNKNVNNKILVQSQSENIILSGVAFTVSGDNASPYYVINYDEGDSTDSVTKGEINKTIKFFKHIKNTRERRWNLLLKSIREVEDHFRNINLDIEFGITNSLCIIVFQVRPITFAQQSIPSIDKKISKIISKSKTQFIDLNKKTRLLGNHTIFSDMADWNPSEIIGNNPHLLDYSLYNYLILEHEWLDGRTNIGYNKIPSTTLMQKFGNKPFIDIRASFNSFIPSNIPPRLKSKLLKFYLEKLENNPHLHDKVEFEILFSCYDFTLNSRLDELAKYGFSKKQIKQINNEIIKFTNEIIKKFPTISEKSHNSIHKLTNNRIQIKKQVKSKSYLSLLDAAECLLRDCKKCGVLPFSSMARIAFIGNILLKSLVKKEFLSQQHYDAFMKSVISPLTEFQNDYESFCNNSLSETNFLQKYGHLRPGTYDITSPRYDKEKSFLTKIKFSSHKSTKFKINDDLSTIFDKHGLDVTAVDFFKFVKQSLSQREYLKFEFTRNLSDALELIAEAGEKLGFTRSEISHLDIKTILQSYKKFNKQNLISHWAKKIKIQKYSFEINNYLVLPSIITNTTDFDIIKYFISEPNFISNKKLVGQIIELKKNSFKNNLTNKIILIENADPGFDWIFTKKPLALITRYGGVASHMAIRCSEIGLPAAIGCGDLLFDKLQLSSKVMLDCKNKQIVILEQSQHDEFMEEKKVLKSLGYIR